MAQEFHLTRRQRAVEAMASGRKPINRRAAIAAEALRRADARYGMVRPLRRMTAA